MPTTRTSDAGTRSHMQELLAGIPRWHHCLFEGPLVRVRVTGKGDDYVICRVFPSEVEGRLPIKNLAGGRFDARRDRFDSIKVGTVLRAHFGFDSDGGLILDERHLYNQKVFEAFPVGKSISLRISRVDPLLGVHLRHNFGDGHFHDVFIPRGHLRHTASDYKVGSRLTASVIVARLDVSDLTIILSERAGAWKRLCALSSETTVQARFRGFKRGLYQFAVFSMRGTLYPSDLPKPFSAEQLVVGSSINVRVKSFVDGRLLLTRRGVEDEPLS